jgi:hypothetical protein
MPSSRPPRRPFPYRTSPRYVPGLIRLGVRAAIPQTRSFCKSRAKRMAPVPARRDAHRFTANNAPPRSSIFCPLTRSCSPLHPHRVDSPYRRALVVDKQHSLNMLIPKKNRKEVYKYLFRGACPDDSCRFPSRSAFRRSSVASPKISRPRSSPDPAPSHQSHPPSQRVSSTPRRTSTSPRTPRSRACLTCRYVTLIARTPGTGYGKP